MKNILYCCAVLLPTALVPFAHADDFTTANKSQYTLINPTPPEVMRPWYTDNGGQTPYTIDAGHFEGDLTAFGYGSFQRDYLAPVYGGYPRQVIGMVPVQRTTREYSIGATEIKAGLLNNVDVELSMVPYTIRTDNYTAPGFANRFYRQSGVDDVESRIKWNLWGNDGGPTALSVGGLVYYPTGTGSITDERFEGGVLMNFEAHLPWDFEMRIHNNALSIADYIQNSAALTRGFSFENEISLLHPIVGDLKGYLLFNTYAYTTAGREWDGSIGTGLNYRFRENVELYAGVNFGVHGNPYDYSPFMGISARF
jgi:hypothetical protein